MLELINITKDYPLVDNVVHALRGVDITFRTNEFVSVLGPSGCGKTTMLNIVGGLDRYTTGDIKIGGVSTKGFKPRDWDTYRSRKIGFVFQSYNLIQHLTVLSNVELALTISGIGAKEKRARAFSALKSVGLEGEENKKPAQLSGGQMQRVAIARAIVNNPEIVLADEPTGALDSGTSEQVMEMLKDISKNRLVIMVTHNGEIANQYSSRIVRLLDGEKVSDSNPPSDEELFEMQKAYNAQGDLGDNNSDFIEPQASKSNFDENNISEGKAKASADITSAKGDISKQADNSKFDEDLSKFLSEGAKASFDKTETHYSNADDAQSPQANNLGINDNLKDEKSSGRKKAKRTAKQKVKKKRSSMSLFTALSLSARNLVTKKLRTSLTTFAGSIGIIGIALVLSISNGFSLYMANLERTTLASFPLSISAYALEVDYTAENLTIDVEGAYPEGNAIVPFEPDNSMGAMSLHPNTLTNDFVSYIKQMENDHPDWAASVAYTQNIQMHIIAKSSGNAYSLVDTVNDTSTWWQELLENDFVDSYYDVLAGRLPKSKNEVVLITNSKNEVTVSSLKAIGYNPKTKLNDEGQAEYLPFDFADFLGDENGDGAKELKLISNDEYYKSTEEGLFKEISTVEYESAYNNSDTALKFVGIIRIKPSSDLSFFNSGVGYSAKLTQSVLDRAKTSQIALKQKETYVDLLGDGTREFEFDFSTVDQLVRGTNVNLVELKNAYLRINAITDAQAEVLGNNYTIDALYESILSNSDDNSKTAIDKLLTPLAQMDIDKNTLFTYINSDYISRLQELGENRIPTEISIFPASFESKAQIREHLDKYNEQFTDPSQHIKYTDLAATVAQSVSQMVDTVSYVLIAFAAISLIVSSVMIAIITYISVLERTKEIGVLRSLGARKIDVSNVFNAETLIIGTSSGVLGVVIAALLNLPINAIISKLLGSMITNIAQLNPLHGILLVALSMVLTVLSGLIPALLASKRDPVVALRNKLIEKASVKFVNLN